jgi:hypothetical protein
MRRLSGLKALLGTLGLCALAIMPMGCAQPYPFGNPQAEARVIGDLSEPVALEPLANMTVVPVTINGRTGFHFLLDTGATPTALFLTDKTRALALTGAGEFRPGGAGEGPAVAGTVATGVGLRIGAVELDNVAVVLLPASVLPILGDEKSFLIDGVIGYDVFSRFAVEVDYAKQRLRFFPPGTAPVLPGDSVLPLEVRGGQAFVSLRLAQRPGEQSSLAHLHLDSGMSGSLALRIGSGAGIGRPEYAWASTGYGLQGAVQSLSASLARLQVGAVELTDLPTYFEANMDAFAGRQGRLGHGVLQRFVHTVDFESKRLILRADANTTRPDPQGVTGLGVVPYGDGFVIRRVQPGTPAAAQGIESGERVISLAGEPLVGKSSRQVASMLELEPGQSIEVCIAAKASPCRTLTAADYRRPPASGPSNPPSQPDLRTN